MSDSAAGSQAWRVSPADYLAGRPRGDTRVASRSLYVPVRDGTRLAIDVHRPAGAGADERLPTVVLFTPYYRRFGLTADAPAGTEASPSYAVYRDFFVPYGYAVAIVDVRGTGASYGARLGFRSPAERLDYHDVVDWIARQPWSNGRVGITGISYVGAAADFAASTTHPAIKAVMPTFSVWDTWGDMFYPGGLLFIGMVGGYGRMIEALDQDRRDVLQEFAYFAGPHFAGPAAVDDDRDGAMARAAIAEHAANFETTAFVMQLRARDAVFDHDPGFGAPTVAPRTYRDGIDPALPHYGVSGWMDGAAYTNAATARFRALRNREKRLLLGPWDHGARTNVSPGRDDPRPKFEMHAEMLRFFDQHVAQRETGIAAEKPIHYFTMIEERWKAADIWPPPATDLTLFLGDGKALVAAAPSAPSASDAYRTDQGIGTGSNTRYERISGQPVEEYYPDWHGRDDRMAIWTGPALERAIEVTGHVVATIWLASEAHDAGVILYLEDVAPDGRTRYVTEGMLRALFRSTAPPPDDYAQVGPWHPCGRADRRTLTPGKAEKLEIVLMPTSWQFRAGHRIRLALAAADRDHLERLPFGISPMLTIYRERDRPSSLVLPVVGV